MNNDTSFDPKHPVSHIKHSEDKRANIPTTERQGEESPIVEGQPSQSEYDIFRHEFRRGIDPELYWLNKYQNDDEVTQMPSLRTNIRSLYVHEDVTPEHLINRLYRIREERAAGYEARPSLFEEMWAQEDAQDELERVASYYQHSANWRNRLILGDSLLVMNSLLNREGMKGKVQCCFLDPPYGIKYGGNWQMRINSTNVKENDNGISGEPEMIKAYRDTWELGVHSYLSYLRDRLVLARELLNETGSCFVQISDENVHLVRNIMDEIFGSENFVSLITMKKSGGMSEVIINNISDYIVWYAKDKTQVKHRKLFIPKSLIKGAGARYNRVEEQDGTVRPIRIEEQLNPSLLPKGARVFLGGPLTSQTPSATTTYDFEFKGKVYKPGNRGWSTNITGMNKLAEVGRIIQTKDFINFKIYFDDFPVVNLSNLWDDTMGTAEQDKQYVVQTSMKPIQRCVLMTTDPGDLVLDPTCGSGTTAFVAEQWGRRWITVDTSRIALNIAKRRIITAVYPYYKTFDENIRHGFLYKRIPHITLKALANDMPFDEEIIYDQPEIDKKRIRVAGPFTVETLQNLSVMSPESLTERKNETEENKQFVERIFDNLRSNGIRNGLKGHAAVFYGIQQTANPYLNAKGLYKDENGNEVLAYMMIGPKFGTVSKQAVNAAIRVFRQKLSEGASTLYILGFSFEDDIANQDIKDYNLGTFHVVKVRMNDDLLQDGLLKKDKAAGSFIIIGEPDIALIRDNDNICHVEIRGMDMYDPIQDRVTQRNVEDIAYWEIDDDYNGSEFRVRAIHFCGGNKKEFDAWKKGLQSVAPKKAKKNAERTLRMEFSDEIWETLYDYKSSSIEFKPGRKIAIRVISQFGEECTKVITLN